MAAIKGRKLTHAKPTTNYASERSPSALEALGLVNHQQAQLLARADRIGLGNADGRTQASEVARLFRKDVFSTLFPAEQALLKDDDATQPSPIWAAFEMGDAEFPLAELPQLRFTETPAHIEPLAVHRPFEISDLPAQYGDIGLRLALTANGGRSPTTLRYSDVVQALSSPRSLLYTHIERKVLEEVREHMLNALLNRAVRAPGVAIATLGEQTMNVSPVPELPVTLHWNDSVIQKFDGAQVSTSLVREAGRVEFVVPPGTRGLVDGEIVLKEGLASSRALPGPYSFEIFDAKGQKILETTFTLPDIDQKIDLSSIGRRPLFVDNGPELDRELREFHGVKSTWKRVPKGTATESQNAAAALAQTQLPASSLKDGVYQFHLGEKEFKLEKYPGPVYRVTDEQGHTHQMDWECEEFGTTEYFLYTEDKLTLRFDPRDNTFSARWDFDDRKKVVVKQLDLVE